MLFTAELAALIAVRSGHGAGFTLVEIARGHWHIAILSALLLPCSPREIQSPGLALHDRPPLALRENVHGHNDDRLLLPA